MKRAAAWLLLPCLALLAAEFSPEKARKVDAFLARIAVRRQPSLFLRKAAFSESELNSYLNLVYVKKYAPEISFIELRLKDKDQVDGRLRVQLKGEKYAAVPQFLRDTEVRFSGVFECSHYRMRFLFSELFINGSRFSPDALDEVYGAAQFSANEKRSLFDWPTPRPRRPRRRAAGSRTATAPRPI